MKGFESFILTIPHPFLKKIAYAWLGVVFFWHWPPVASSFFLAVMLLGLGLMAIQNRFWEVKIRRENNSGDSVPYIEQAHASRVSQILNILIVLIVSAGLGWLLNGQFDLSGLQWFFLLAGFMLLYKDAVLLGAWITYIVTDQGIGIRYVPGDFRPFFKFSEIRQVVRVIPPKCLPPHWDVLAPRRHSKEGLLLVAADPGGFSKEILGEVLLAPMDIGRFLKELEGRVKIGFSTKDY